MISSQPSGGDEPPRRSGSGSSGQRDGPPRSHTLPYDRPDRPERYDRPRPARRDSRAGPEVRERDWRRTPRPSHQYSQPHSSIHSFNRRDDRSARDRLLHERKRFDRPRERPERPERSERPERLDRYGRGDKLDRRSAWQHTSAPYIRENGHHNETNGNGYAESTRAYDEDEARLSRTGRQEPRFTRRPGNSFWDLMKGESQRSEKPRSSIDKPNYDARRTYDDRRVKHTERPRIDKPKDRSRDPSRELSRSVSPRVEHSQDIQQSISEPHKPPPLAATPPMGSSTSTTIPSESTDKADTGAEVERIENIASPAGSNNNKTEQGVSENSRVTSLGSNPADPPSPGSHESASHDLASIKEETIRADHPAPESTQPPDHKPVKAGPKDDTNDPSTTADVTERRVNGMSHGLDNVDMEDTQPSESKPVEVNRANAEVSAALTTPTPAPVDAVSKHHGSEKSESSGQAEDPSSDTTMELHSSNTDVHHKAPGNIDDVAKSGSSPAEEEPPSEPAMEITDTTNKTTDGVLANTDAVYTDATSTNAMRSTDSSAVKPAVKNTGVENAEVVDKTTLHQDQDIEMPDVEMRDVEMPDTVDSSEPEVKVKPHSDAIENRMDYFLQAQGEYNTFSEEPFMETPPSASSDPPGRPIVQTPQELQFHEHLVSQYNTVSSEVAPGSFSSKRWSLNAPDPRVSLTVMTQHAELQNDIRARQIEFAERKREWLVFCKELDEDATLRSKSGSAKTSTKGEVASSNHTRRRSKDFEPELHRRNRERSRAHGDVARSEAEFLEILANLEAETARDPLVRARQTSARIPPQRQGPVAFRFRSTDALVVDHSKLTERLKTDAVDDFTPEEHERFVEAYVKFPKEFGQIAEAVGRGFNECVMHYYRTKKSADYKRILQKRRKSKRGRKPKKKEFEGELPTTPSMDGSAQFESPGTPKTPFTPTESAVTSTTPINILQNESVSASPNTVEYTAPRTDIDLGSSPSVPLAIQPEVQPEIQPTAMQPAVQPAVQPSVEPTVQSKAVEPEAVQPLSEPDSQQDVGQNALESRIPPPVFPLTEQSAVQGSDNGTGRTTMDDYWPPSTVAQLEHLFGVYGSKLDEIAQQMGLPADMVRKYYERNHHKYLSIIQKTDSLNARSKGTVGPNVGFFPPRNKNLPVAKVSRAKQDNTAYPASLVQPIQPIQPVQPIQQQQQQQQYVKQQLQQPVSTYYDGIPPVVQPANIRSELLPQQQSEPAAQVSEVPLEPQAQHAENLYRHENGPAHTQQTIPSPEVLEAAQRQTPLSLPSVKMLNLATLPILPCLPNPRKLADPADYYALDYPFQRYRESDERHR